MSLLNYFSKATPQKSSQPKPTTAAESSTAATTTTTKKRVANDDDNDDNDDDNEKNQQKKQVAVGDHDDDDDNDDADGREGKKKVGAGEKERDAKLREAKLANELSESKRERYKFLVDPRDEAGRRRGEPGYDPSTLLIPPTSFASFTAFETSFWSIKRKHFDCIIFFKKGKFYELFETDAEIGASVLGLKMSQRGNMRLAGVPFNFFNAWAKKLLDLGYKIGRVDEVESRVALAKRQRAGDADKVMQRELVQILTPATIVDDELLTTQYENHLLALVEWQRAVDREGDQAPELQFGVCYVDASIGKFHIAHVADDSRRLALQTLLQRAAPKEVLHFGLSSGTQQLAQA